MTLFINIRVPVENTGAYGALVVCQELLTANRPGEIGLVSDKVWITDEAGETVATVKGGDHA